MYIKLLKIKNFRNFGDPPFEIELRPFTLILGENNIGKTNLVSALGLIFSQEISIARKRILDIDDINYTAVSKFKNQVCDIGIPPESIDFPEVRIDVYLTGFDKNIDQSSIVDHWIINQNASDAQLTYIFLARQGLDKAKWIIEKREKNQNSGLPPEQWQIDFPINEYRPTIFGGNDPNRDSEYQWLQKLKMEILEAMRDAPKELIASSDYRLLYRILNRNSNADYQDIKQVLEKLHDQIKQNPNLATIKTDVKKLLDRVSLETTASDNNIDFKFAGVDAADILKKLGLVYGINPIDISRNGLGRNNLLFISLILSQLSASSLHGDDVYFRLIAIEEPESHLHPQLQDHLAENIEEIRNESADEMQLLITSHSTHIAAKLSLENTCVLYWDSQNNRFLSHYIMRGLDGSKETDTALYLKRYLDATKSRVFFARKVILVEGFAEQFLIPEFFRLYNGNDKTIEKMNCNIVNVNGVAFRHFLKVIKNGYFIKCVVFTDQDTNTKTENRADQLRTEFNQPNLISVEVTNLSTFEKDLIEANKSGSGKKLLLKALKAIKPSGGKTFEQTLGEKDIDVEAFFSEIKNYKSEFAFRLAEQLKLTPNALIIPDYIQRGFKFLLS